jgi:acyl dehydratase
MRLEAGAITRERMVAIMGVMGDPNPIHEDEELAARLGFRGIVNQGPANLAYVVNMLLEEAGDPAAIRELSFRFLDNVVPGDECVATGEWVSEDACAFKLESQGGRVHLTGEAKVVMPDARA